MQAIIGPDGLLRLRDATYRAALGRGGIVVHKREGDGATPAGVLPLRRVLYRADRVARPKCTLPVSPLAPHDGWCDDPASRHYNRPIRTPSDDRHETLWRADPLYDVIGVLGWNDAPPVKDFGSAIFLHLARPDLAPTEGCIALALPELLAVLAGGLTEIDVRLD